MRFTSFIILILSVTAASAAPGDIDALRTVGDGGAGTTDAQQAQASLLAGGTDNLLPILQAFQDASPLASNWLRGTFEALADQEIRAGRALPQKELLEFVRDTSESPRARRLAFEWLSKGDSKIADTLIPSMLLDPSPDFRRDAVAHFIEQAEQATGGEALQLYARALKGAVHKDQVDAVVKKLREADVDVDLQRHFGFLPDWHVIGPFDNRDMKGFPIAYPPESTVDLTAEYDGQLGKVQWQPLSTDDDYGTVDIGKQIENYKGSIMYATTTFDSQGDQQVEIRLGTPNAWKLWLNDELVFEREEYHRSTRMDQYRMSVPLQAGENRLLLKVCQNEQTQDWAQRYSFQLRVCDRSGAAILPARAGSDN